MNKNLDPGYMSRVVLVGTVLWVVTRSGGRSLYGETRVLPEEEG